MSLRFVIASFQFRPGTAHDPEPSSRLPRRCAPFHEPAVIANEVWQSMNPWTAASLTLLAVTAAGSRSVCGSGPELEAFHEPAVIANEVWQSMNPPYPRWIAAASGLAMTELGIFAISASLTTLGKKMPGWREGQPGCKPFLLSRAKAPLREEKRDAAAKMATARGNSTCTRRALTMPLKGTPRIPM